MAVIFYILFHYNNPDIWTQYFFPMSSAASCDSVPCILLTHNEREQIDFKGGVCYYFITGFEMSWTNL